LLICALLWSVWNETIKVNATVYYG
jgi:hypothetical protein